MANNPNEDVRNGSDEVGPIGFQIFSSHEKHCESKVKDTLQRSRNKKHHDDR